MRRGGDLALRHGGAYAFQHSEVALLTAARARLVAADAVRAREARRAFGASAASAALLDWLRGGCVGRGRVVRAAFYGGIPTVARAPISGFHSRVAAIVTCVRGRTRIVAVGADERGKGLRAGIVGTAVPGVR
jgi:hypothetical protein